MWVASPAILKDKARSGASAALAGGERARRTALINRKSTTLPKRRVAQALLLVTALSSISVSAAFDRTFLLEGGSPTRISPKLINDWYPEKVNQAFQHAMAQPPSLFAGIGNRVAFHPA
jgi:hypothetical protein